MKQFCKIRDIQQSILIFEQSFSQQYGICLNEGMALCSLSKSPSGELTSGEISTMLGITSSNTSKVLASLEKKELVLRALGKLDKRQMCFSLTDKAVALLKSINMDQLELPPLLQELLK